MNQRNDVPSSLNNPTFGSHSSAVAIAQTSLSRDVEEDSADAAQDPDSDSQDEDAYLSTLPGSGTRPTLGYSMAGSYRRTSIATGTRPSVVPSLRRGSDYLTKNERNAVLEEERSLLRDNRIIPPKHPRRHSVTPNSKITNFVRRLSVPPLRKSINRPDEESAIQTNSRESDEDGASETTPLIADLALPYGGQDSPDNIDRKWEEAVSAGQIHTTWQREAKVLGRYSRSLILTFLLQYSLPVASVFTVGHLGKIELGAVSLGSMTASITGYAVYQGLVTSLDTLCAQAYGSGRRKLVGLHMQRMVYFLWCVTIPIGIIWLSGARILSAIVPEPETARLAGLYLKILLLGAPGYAAFESGKRFVQAQGLFTPTLYVLLIIAPLNAFLHWLFVWYFKWGFIGAPIAVVIAENLLPLGLFLYVRFVDGMQCWGGFNRAALKNWSPMVRLALPGLLMVLAEYLAFEILTLSASWISATHLAAQSVLSTIIGLTFQIPFPISIAASTRIANLIGATLAPAAKTSAKVALVAACFVGLLNAVLLSTLRFKIPQLFTNDRDVADLVVSVLPITAGFQLFDALAANCNGILRGIGRQKFGGWVNLICYYAVSAIEYTFSGDELTIGLDCNANIVRHWVWLALGVAWAVDWSCSSTWIVRADMFHSRKFH